MSGAVEVEGRARPLSGGLWTLFSWLRRDEHSSTESVSSAGSDRTAASFAFLAPALYGPAGVGPAARPPPSPPSDSYRRRVRERCLRRHRDRDLTLHRKYGLYGLGFDASSLPLPAPSAHRPEERDRRAASECPRAHVPGKRRAPPPPVTTATLPRRHARKRPAPLPPSPARLSTSNLPDFGPMPRLPSLDERPSRARDDADCKPEKYSKKNTHNKESKDTKIRHEKSFLKQIFEHKKRNSATETVSLKLLPNISELDKQAAEMIEKYRLKEMTPTDVPEREIEENESTSKRKTEAWICTRCLKKYDSSVITCNYCLPLNKGYDFYKNSKLSNSATQTKGNLNVASGITSTNIEEKERLKEILKEMKDSLPKRPKSELITSNKFKTIHEMETKDDYPKVVEAPTLRIGSSTLLDKKASGQASTCGVVTEPSTSQLVPQSIKKTNSNALTTINSVIITQPVVMMHTKESNVVLNQSRNIKGSPVQLLPVKNESSNFKDGPTLTVVETEKSNPSNDPKPLNILSKTKYDLNTPLKISSLLNPIYVPKTTSTTNTEAKLVKYVDLKDNKREKGKITKQQSNTAENVNDTVTPSPNLIPTTSQAKSNKQQPNSAEDVNVTVVMPSSNLIPQTKSTKQQPNIAEDVNVTVVTPSSNLIPLIPQTKSTKQQPNNAEDVNVTVVTPFSNLIPLIPQTKSTKQQPNIAEDVNVTVVTLSSNLIPSTPQTNKDDISISETKNKHKELALNANANLIQIKNAKPYNNEIKTISNPILNEGVHVQMKVAEPNNAEVKTSKNLPLNENVLVVVKDANFNNTELKSSNNLVNDILSNVGLSTTTTSKENRIDQHVRRRDLINQLERSIAKGDEKAAAEAAIKLAQLKLSCSVLSFSSQIVGEASPSTSSQQTNILKPESDRKVETKKVAQKSSITDLQPTQVVPVRQTTENLLIQNMNKRIDEKQLISSVKENIQQSIKSNTADLPKTEPVKQTQPTYEPKNRDLVNSGPSEASTSKVPTKKENNDGDIPILIWVEDKEATRGPVQLQVRRGAVIGDLRRQAERTLGLAARLQRWIVGRTLCSDDRATLVSLAGPDLSAPFYLCLVESDTKSIQKAQPELDIKEDTGNVYNELVKLEKQPLVSNAEVFECGVCIEECRPGSGVVLRECVHSFCKECLSDVVRHSEEPVVGCPAMGCRGVLQEREIRGLVSPDDYEKWLARGLAAAESGTKNAFHCRTKDCSGWALCEPGVRRFPCPVCKRTNCVPCQAIHEGSTCEQHRAKLESAAGSNASQTDEGTRALLNSLISRGEALECPECSAIITKKWGCDWIKCSACKTEICWVTRGRRWGPAGRGDTSGGCRCGVDGKRCHPSCGYCH